MKLAVITDSSAFLQAETLRKEDLFVARHSCEYRWTGVC